MSLTRDMTALVSPALGAAAEYACDIAAGAESAAVTGRFLGSYGAP